jgi:drug/metabolite transporter (DMT)-like permease
VYGFLVPVLGGTIAVLVLDERLTGERVIGALIVIGGLVITRLGKSGPRPQVEKADQTASR